MWKRVYLKLKVRDYNNGNYPKTCSSKCAHSRIKSAETRKKVSESCKAIHPHICPKCGISFMHKGTSPIIHVIKKYLLMHLKQNIVMTALIH